ncbi:MAG TPA: OmpA family protein [Rhizomicrobium sp.]|nr:OmpA family protein [Rhizomicrobium sp.]
MVEPWQTVQIEHEDRQRRLKRLSNLQGIAPPEFYEYVVPRSQHKLADYPVALPVLRVVFSDKVFFDFNRDRLRPESSAVLNTVAESLRLEPPDVTVFIAGHTDAIGSVNYNLNLGLRRARSVAVALAKIGVNKAQIFLVSFGKAVPIASNDSEEGRARNRRVEFLFAARPEPIAAWLAEQNAKTCAPDGSAEGDNCQFRAQSVNLVTPGQKFDSSHAPQSISIDLRKSSVALNTPTKDVVIGSKVIDIDLRQKVFTMPPPE